MALLENYSYARRAPHVVGPQDAVHRGTVELTCLSAGQEWVRLEDDPTRHLERGSVVIIPAGTAHSSGTHDHDAAFHVLQLNADRMQALSAELGSPHLFTQQGLLALPEAVRAIFTSINREHALGDVAGHTLALDALALNLVVQLARVGGRSRPLTGTARTPAVARAEEVLRTSPEVDHSLDSLAAVAGLSPFHFVRTFKKVYGVTPHQRLLELRVARAAVLMQQRHRSLTEIAHDVGFGSSSRLTEAFKARFGVTPSQWRLAEGHSTIARAAGSTAASD